MTVTSGRPVAPARPPAPAAAPPPDIRGLLAELLAQDQAAVPVPGLYGIYRAQGRHGAVLAPLALPPGARDIPREDLFRLVTASAQDAARRGYLPPEGMIGVAFSGRARFAEPAAAPGGVRSRGVLARTAHSVDITGAAHVLVACHSGGPRFEFTHQLGPSRQDVRGDPVPGVLCRVLSALTGRVLTLGSPGERRHGAQGAEGPGR